ncbi:MAG: bifunctional UDP-sugar hydrolase/5'-nucleotidase [Candidatus Eremiobacteraeota bacterium]|nr:bifunctional UDP-sugar hydrolase/5'-nucleotidase [Candidatus Eremiobacteraeota bacterium]
MNMNPLNFNAAGNAELSPHRHHREIKNDTPTDIPEQAAPGDSVDINAGTEGVKQEKPDTPRAAASPNGTTTITILSTNDMHAQFKNMPEVSGLVHQLKKENPDAIVVDVGDIAYNPPYSDANHFSPMLEIMNQIGYHIVEPGNHEFQYGAPAMHDEYTSRINADVVCSNIRDKKTGDYLPGVKPYVIKDVEGVKVAFIGTVVPHMATSAHPDVGKDVDKREINDTVRELLPELKAQGAEVIVSLSHHGVGKKADLNLAENVEGINVILTGHDHQFTGEPIVVSKFPTRTYIIEGMSHGKYVMETDITIDNKTREVIAVNMKPWPTSSATVKPDPVVEDIIKNYHSKGGGEIDMNRDDSKPHRDS